MNEATGWPPPQVRVVLLDRQLLRDGPARPAHRPGAPSQRRTAVPSQRRVPGPWVPDPGQRWYRNRSRAPPPARAIAISRRTVSWGGRYGARRSPVARSGSGQRGAGRGRVPMS